MIILLLILFAIIAYVNIPPLVKKKQWWDLKVYCGFFVVALTLSVLLALGVDIPSPIKGIQFIIKDLLHLNYQ